MKLVTEAWHDNGHEVAKCLGCEWSTEHRSITPQTTTRVAREHVRQTGHRVQFRRTQFRSVYPEPPYTPDADTVALRGVLRW